jgi:hypothetical protein
VAIAKVTDEIDDAIRIGVPEAHPHPGAVNSLVFIEKVSRVHLFSPESSWRHRGQGAQRWRNKLTKPILTLFSPRSSNQTRNEQEINFGGTKR